jgi:hypothetical protein
MRNTAKATALLISLENRIGVRKKHDCGCIY